MKLGAVASRSATALVGIALLVVGGASAASGDPTAPSRLSFSDPAADATDAPDVTNVSVVGDARTGMVAVSVTATGARPASPDGRTRAVLVWLDTDSNPNTGDAGAEYLFLFADDPTDPEHFWNMGRWDGSAWQPLEFATAMGFDRTGDVLTWRLSTAQLGGATRFTIVVGTRLRDVAGNVIAHDSAPDLGEWIYDIAGPTRSTTAFVTPVIGKPVTVPVRVRPGQRVTVSVPVTRVQGEKSVPLTKGTMICHPAIAGRTIAHGESFKNGVARLSFVVPKSAKGKLLKLTMTIKAASYRGEDGTFFDVANARYGLVANLYSGRSTTRVFSFAVR